MLSIQYFTWISQLGNPSIVICIVVVNAISVIQRRFDRSSHLCKNTCAKVSSLRDSITGSFLWIFRNLGDHFIYKTPLGDYFHI